MATARANQLFIRDAMRHRLLEREEELALVRRWRDKRDENALHILINAHVRQVVACANRFRNYSVPVGDLIQEGNIGLLLAADRFDADRDVRFSTYAGWWIRSAMQEYVLRNWSIVRTGTTAAHRKLFFNLRRLRAQIAGTGDAPLTDDQIDEIGTHLGLHARDVAHMAQRLSGRDQSLNALVSDDGETERQDLLADPADDPEIAVMSLHDARTRARCLAEALDELPERERWIIRQRRLSEDAPTLETLGAQLGVSKERVRQLEARALEKLRCSLVANPGPVGDLISA
jgi:RNA polymerase sigma-32 factor